MSVFVQLAQIGSLIHSIHFLSQALRRVCELHAGQWIVSCLAGAAKTGIAAAKAEMPDTFQPGRAEFEHPGRVLANGANNHQ